MIFDLSKDKNLLNILSKVDLDEETSNLVKSKASTYSIIKSLESNITSSNLIQYRKYILKAKDKYDKEQEAEEAAEYGIDLSTEEGKEELASQRETRQMTGSAGTDVDETEEAQRLREEGQESELSSDALQRKKYKKALKELKLLERLTVKLKDIQSDINSNNTMVSKTYDSMSKDQSNLIITWLTFLKKDSNALVEKYDELLDNPDISGKDEPERKVKVLTGKTWNKEGVESDSKELDIIVDDLQDSLNELLDTTFTINNLTMGFYEIMVKLHHLTYKTEPTTTVNKPQRIRNLRAFLESVEGKSGDKEKDSYVIVIERLENLNSSLDALLSKKASFENEIKRISEIGSSVDNIIADKLQQLTRGLNAVINDSKRLNLTDEFIKDKLKEIKELRENPKQYEEELREALENKITIEKVKLDKVMEDLNRFDRFDVSLQRFNKIMRLHKDSPPMGEVEELMVKTSSLLVDMHRKVKRLNVIIDSRADIIANWTVEQLKAGKIVDKNTGYDGMDTVDRNTITEIDTLTNKYAELNSKVKDLIQKIDALL